MLQPRKNQSVMMAWTLRICPGLSIVVLFLSGVSRTGAADWPMWRYDSGRTAASPDSLPDQLQLHWRRSYPKRVPAWDDPLNQDLMTYDRIFEPIVAGGRLIVGFNDKDKVVALDTKTGEPVWTVYTDAPVRLPPAAKEGTVYFTSDDGCLYCVRLDSGQVQWKFRGSPGRQMAIGNRRLVSAWPARGGVVIRDDTVYFAASIWPFMGTFLYALDASDGTVRWVNDSSGSQYIKQPHSAPSFAGVAPQGALVATQNRLIVPGGRSVPAIFERQTGELRHFELNAGGKGTGGSFVAANELHFHVHTRRKGTVAFRLDNAQKTRLSCNEPVLSRNGIYTAESDNDQFSVRGLDAEYKTLWSIAANGTGDLIQAGNCLYAAGTDSITAIRLPQDEQSAAINWTLPVEGTIERLLAADDRLFAVTLEGDLLAFGPGPPNNGVDPVGVRETQAQTLSNPASAVKDLLKGVQPEGYGLWFGNSLDPRLAALVESAPFVQLAVVDQDAERVASARRQFDRLGLYGRITVHHERYEEFQPPNHAAHAVWLNDPKAASESLIRHLYRAVRPYGGVLKIVDPSDRSALKGKLASLDLEQAQVEELGRNVLLRRSGRLPGAADWTHQYGNIANTIKSNDSRVKLPLGVLWFGGSSNMDVLPRHGHGPPEQVIGGRLFIEGMNSLSARDVYTGRVLWKRVFEDLGTFDVYFDDTYADTPLDPRYNQVHIPGANGRGTNYVATDEFLYLVEQSRCLVLDPANGDTKRIIELPRDDDGQQPEWGFVGVYRDVLLAGYGFARYGKRQNLDFETDEKLSRNRRGFGSKSLDRAASMALIGFDRFSGKELWRVPANHSFWHNGIVAGSDRIYCLDRKPKAVEDALRRRGRFTTDGYRIIALDYRTGETRWEETTGIFGTWLGYSVEEDLLLQAGAAASDRLSSEIGQGMTVYRGTDGKVQWRKDELRYSGPCVLHQGMIITNANSYAESAGAFRLSDGQQKMVNNPLTGESQPWTMTRAYGCNNIIASEHLLTFRSGAAGFYDLQSESGTGNLGGFKSGCTSNLVVANGVLNAPDYTRTCSCAYQNQTSLALVHMPEMEIWTVSHAAGLAEKNRELKQIGVNLGAPGDRRDPTGLLWLDYPSVGGESPEISIEVNREATRFQQHASSVPDPDWAWVMASGLTDLSELSIRLKVGPPFNAADGIPLLKEADDAEESPSGKVSLTSSDLEFLGKGENQLVALRFDQIPLQREARIRRAFLQFTTDEPSKGPSRLEITLEESGNSAALRARDFNLSKRPTLDASVRWSPPPWPEVGSSGTDQQTPDLAELITRIIRRDDWRSGQALTFLIRGTGHHVAVSTSRKNPHHAPRLVLELEEPVKLTEPEAQATKYHVTLFFSVPRDTAAERHVFDVQLQDSRAPQRITLMRPNALSVDSPGRTTAVHTFENVPITEILKIRMRAIEGQTMLSGIRVERTDSTQSAR